MQYIADLHIHSKYSRACSKSLTPENIAKWCEKKGIDIVSTADFTHPGWYRELQENLEPAERGLYKLKGSENATRFLVSTEISCIYKKGGKCRRIHLCLWMPSLETAKKFTKVLISKGCNVSSDGRPILGIDSEEILKIAMEITPDSMVIPAHAWTPWFAVFGSMSGFDSLEEAFGENAKYIYAIETGLSSDPAMNWRLSQLDDIILISNSDAHSLEKLGREANVFEFKTRPDYYEIVNTIKHKDREKFLHTIEFFPEEGKYHFDGHRNCKIFLDPEETKKNSYLCPKCKRPLTIGVTHRIETLADRPSFTKVSDGKKKEDVDKIKEKFVSYKSIIPLQEIIAECFGQGVKTKKVVSLYEKLISECGSEFNILLDKNINEIKKCAGEIVGEAVDRVRKGNIFIRPGYDGEFGDIKIFNSDEREKIKQGSFL
ncbi:endonuclease Q family protein [Candidatus Parcubacteria bacterium]|nr:endonuclease Q family protein [Patescibacteria group bacterium]MCG2694194.1 endonuclease Q family protein [Candidatus Parcubacteria bacterium]